MGWRDAALDMISKQRQEISSFKAEVEGGVCKWEKQKPFKDIHVVLSRR
jgi:putative redox protein